MCVSALNHFHVLNSLGLLLTLAGIGEDGLSVSVLLI